MVRCAPCLPTWYRPAPAERTAVVAPLATFMPLRRCGSKPPTGWVTDSIGSPRPVRPADSGRRAPPPILETLPDRCPGATEEHRGWSLGEPASGVFGGPRCPARSDIDDRPDELGGRRPEGEPGDCPADPGRQPHPAALPPSARSLSGARPSRPPIAGPRAAPPASDKPGDTRRARLPPARPHVSITSLPAAAQPLTGSRASAAASSTTPRLRSRPRCDRHLEPLRPPEEIDRSADLLIRPMRSRAPGRHAVRTRGTRPATAASVRSGSSTRLRRNLDPLTAEFLGHPAPLFERASSARASPRASRMARPTNGRRRDHRRHGPSRNPVHLQSDLVPR
jgi:hypothetical protein